MKNNLRLPLCGAALALALLPRANAQVAVSEITIRTAPPGGRIRPLETAVVQVLVYGAAAGRRVRLPGGGVEFRVLERRGGWLSKPFVQQGNDDPEPLYPGRQPAPAAKLDLTFGGAARRDSVLYTAPAQPGTYRVQASLEGRTAIATLRVGRDAPSRRPPEGTSFGRGRRPADPYRKLAEHYAPYIAQETWFDPKADFLARFDFDGNWRGDDNWDATPRGSSQAYVYYAVIETHTHWFLIYNFFHPRDYAERCLLFTCHENDNEGLILTVRKDGSRLGRPQVMQTLAHDRIYSYRADARVQDGLHKITGAVEFYQGSHPGVFIEAGGHGVLGSADERSAYSLSQNAFNRTTGVTYLYGGRPERPKHASDRRVRYDLLPIYEQWWQRAVDGRGRREAAFDDYFAYAPLGGRPGVRYQEIPRSFLGRARASNRARPFWAWMDPSTRAVLAPGQWGLDPAYAVSRTLRFPAGEPFSLEYVFNPFLQDNPPSRGF